MSWDGHLTNLTGNRYFMGPYKTLTDLGWPIPYHRGNNGVDRPDRTHGVSKNRKFSTPKWMVKIINPPIFGGPPTWSITPSSIEGSQTSCSDTWSTSCLRQRYPPEVTRRFVDHDLWSSNWRKHTDIHTDTFQVAEVKQEMMWENETLWKIVANHHLNLIKRLFFLSQPQQCYMPHLAKAFQSLQPMNNDVTPRLLVL